MTTVTAPRDWRPSLGGRFRGLLRPAVPHRSQGRLWHPSRADHSGHRAGPQPQPVTTSLPAEQSLDEVIRAILALLDLSDDWDSEGAAAPTRDAVAHACSWVAALHAHLFCSGGRWLAPLVSDSADGGVMLEWWNHVNRRKLTVYIWGDRTQYIQVWGPDMRHQMAEGDAEPLATFAPIWSWLTR